MTNDVEVLLSRRRFKVSRDRIEFGIRRPRTTRQKVFAAIFELTFADIVGHIYEMKLMRDIRLFTQRAKPGSLFLRVAGEIEHDGHASGE